MSNIADIKNEFQELTLQLIREAKKAGFHNLSAEKIKEIRECAQASISLNRLN